MTRAGTVPLSSIERIQIYYKTKKNTKANLKQILKDTGGDMVFNGSFFLNTLKPCCHLKVDGVVKCTPNYKALAITWNTPEDFRVAWVPTGDANYMEARAIIYGGKKKDVGDIKQSVAYATNRTAIGVKEGRFAYYVTEDNLTPTKLQKILFDAGWSDAIMMDGGGSTCFMDKDGNGFAGDGRSIPFYIVVHLKPEQDPEPKGEKPMVEINAYSKAKDGNKKLSANFKVKEFACADGSDPIFVAPALVEILQKIRTHFGKAVNINSAYRTPSKNKAVGGATYSQHLYGTAADISIKGVTPKQVAAYAETLLPKSGGIGIYSTFTHIDVRETKSRWNG